MAEHRGQHDERKQRHAEDQYQRRAIMQQPAPFAFSDQQLVRRILTEAGYQSIAIKGIERPMVMGGGEGIEAAIQHGTDSGPARRALSDCSAEERARAGALVRAMLEARPEAERFTFAGAVWLVTGRAGTS